MLRLTKRYAVYSLLIALAAPFADACAQFPGGGGMGGGMGRGMGGGRGAREQKPDTAPVLRRHLPDDVDDRLYMLEQDLRLMSEQQPLWERYADSVRLTAKDIERDRAQNEFREKLPVLERLDRLVETSRNRLTALEEVSASGRALYNTLVPRQREICDPRLATIAALLVEVTPEPGNVAQRSRR
ncbi:MAG TPA: Spy/CpxP family protein refolding chaperone [Burkholderiales bacterium]